LFLNLYRCIPCDSGLSWSYIADSFEESMSDPNEILQRLSEFEQRGWQHLYNDATADAKNTFELGQLYARRNELPCWDILFEFYICQIYVYYTFDLKTAVDAAVRLTARLRKTEMQLCRERMLVYGILVHAYFYRDCLGYEQEIREALQYIESELPLDSEAILRVEYIRAELDLEYGRYDAVQERLMLYLAKAENSHSYRKADGCRVGHMLSYARGDFALARDYAARNAQHSDDGQHQRGIADALIWQAVYTLKLGQEGAAQRILQQALDHYKRFNLAPALIYFDALCDFHEISGDMKHVLSLREQQFSDLHLRGSLHDLAKAHLQYCRLLGRMGKPLDSAIAQAHAFLNTLQKPAVHRAALTRIENGDYYQFDWQRP
jgi:hypothetical protein